MGLGTGVVGRVGMAGGGLDVLCAAVLCGGIGTVLLGCVGWGAVGWGGASWDELGWYRVAGELSCETKRRHRLFYVFALGRILPSS